MVRGPRRTEIWMKGNSQRLRGLERKGRVHSESLQGGRRGRRKASCVQGAALQEGGGKGRDQPVSEALAGPRSGATAGQDPDGQRKEAGRKNPNWRLIRGCCSSPGKEG